MNLSAKLECFNKSCKREYRLDEIIYNCESCNSLLEVVHDYDQLSLKSAKEWKALFRDRIADRIYPYDSGVWRFKELVNPDIETENIVSIQEGNTILKRAGRLAEIIGIDELYIKLSGNSHTGSFKDLGMTVLVSQVKNMIAKGIDIRAIACASTGDTSAALAAYASMAGIKSVVFLPAGKISNEQLIQPISHGSIVMTLDTDFDGCMKIVQKISEDKSIYLANSKNSLRVEGQKTVSFEIAEALGWDSPDTIIIPGGNLGNVAALGKGFITMEKLKLISKRPRIIVAQAENANPLYLSYKKGFSDFENIVAKKTYASAIQIGAPVSKDKAIKILKEFNGMVGTASEQELVNAAAIADTTGFYTCPHTAVALGLLFKLVKKGEIKKSEKVVVISTAHGLKFSNFKLKYHEKRLDDIDPVYSNLPVKISAEYDKVKEKLEKLIDQPILIRK